MDPSEGIVDSASAYEKGVEVQANALNTYEFPILEKDDIVNAIPGTQNSTGVTFVHSSLNNSKLCACTVFLPSL